jgi:hypothetical protein
VELRELLDLLLPLLWLDGLVVGKVGSFRLVLLRLGRGHRGSHVLLLGSSVFSVFGIFFFICRILSSFLLLLCLLLLCLPLLGQLGLSLGAVEESTPDLEPELSGVLGLPVFFRRLVALFGSSSSLFNFLLKLLSIQPFKVFLILLIVSYLSKPDVNVTLQVGLFEVDPGLSVAPDSSE